jgi:hypothetical protein
MDDLDQTLDPRTSRESAVAHGENEVTFGTRTEQINQKVPAAAVPNGIRQTTRNVIARAAAGHFQPMPRRAIGQQMDVEMTLAETNQRPSG